MRQRNVTSASQMLLGGTSRQRRPLPSCVQMLENRVLLSASVTVDASGYNAKFFSALVTDNVYLQDVVTGGTSKFQWSSDGSSWQDISNLKLAPSGSTNAFTFQMSGAVHVTSFIGNGGGLTLQGTGNASRGFVGPSDVHVDGDLLTQGGDLTIKLVQGVDVASNVIVSTRHISDTDLASGLAASTGSSLKSGLFSGSTSVGNSGTIDVEVANTDILNPTLYVDFTHPHIELGTNASMLANASAGFAARNVTLDATNINYSEVTQLFPLLSAMQRHAAVTMDANSTVMGNDVTFNAHAGDLNALNELLNYFGKTLSPSETAALASGEDLIISKLNPFALPLSVIYKSATATVTVGNSAHVQASGKVDLESDADTSAAADALFLFNEKLQVALALAISDADAETTVNTGATITGSGDVNLQSTGSSVAQASALSVTRTAAPSNTVQIAGGVSISKITSHATVAQGATVTSTAGNVNVRAEGVNNSGATVATKTNAKGASGFTFGVNDTTTDILAEVDGTVSAQSSPVGTD